ncbi:lantibiotic immunity ABC transporter MutE/EpiE family permease subunit [Clostridium uliginosum]|uniref:ABC-2 type transport system permease protein n=1 Tax=Clostridium uliginosum TaxID=119641 RepID=A0A1I1JFM4_9CLOT|nr:lantibiotic immunity ABC transporter MutE/EpiE family permease subunit [Clostridium uliginosum]SFC47256.1 ABC-2 type transport system permease protein [Clostridium uliginosum]
MLNMLRSENLKYKRTFAKMLAFIAPMYVLVCSLFMSVYFFTNTINWWEVSFMPFIICLICALSAIREKKSGNYRTLKSKDVNLKKMWISKIIVIGYYTFIASLMILINFLIVKLIFNNKVTDSIYINKLIIAVFIIWLTTLILIPICLFVAEKFGTFLAILVNCIGSVVGLFIVTGKKWYLCPWNISNRLMCPILNLNPNGMLLESGDPLLDSSVISIGIIVSIVGLIILSVLTSLWFAKREAS